MEEVISGIERHCDIRVIRGWKLFLLLPRLLLYRPSRGGQVPRKQLGARMQQFQSGNWVGLLDYSQSCNARAHQSSVRRRRRDQEMDVEKSAPRGLCLLSDRANCVKGMYPAPDIHEHFTIHKWLRQTAYILTHNLNKLEHIANNCMSAMTHTDVTTAHH